MIDLTIYVPDQRFIEPRSIYAIHIHTLYMHKVRAHIGVRPCYNVHPFPTETHDHTFFIEQRCLVKTKCGRKKSDFC